MKISQIDVRGLYGRFNHELPFNPDERVSIMIGPNGFGKTMILRILNAIFNLRVRSLERMPFEIVTVFFDDQSTLFVRRNPGEQVGRRHRQPFSLEIGFSDAEGIREPFVPEQRLRREDLPFPVNSIEDWIPDLDQVASGEWVNRRTGDLLDLDDVVSDFGEHLPVPVLLAEIPSWLDDIKRGISIRFIGTERLIDPPTGANSELRHRRPNYRSMPKRTITRYSEQLGEMVQQKLAEYATLSQSLDRTFPGRLVEGDDTPQLSGNELQAKLQEVEAKRTRVAEAGFLGEEIDTFSLPIIDQIDESKQGVLAVYANDALTKLSVFDDLYARVDTMKRIANSRLLYKQISVSSEGLSVSEEDGSDLDLEMLSSGEQHELVLLYDLLFETAQNSLIMIDEPELSLHVAWQEQILGDLQAMADLSDFHVLMATHSPEIIGGRWDLTIELQGPEQR